MAQQTTILACTQAAMTSRSNPSTNYHGSASYRIFGMSQSNSVIYADLYLGFSGFPVELSRQRLLSATLGLSMDRVISSAYVPNIHIIGCDFFDEDVITFNDPPGLTGQEDVDLDNPPSGSGAYNYSYLIGDGVLSKPLTVKGVISSRALEIHFSGIPDTGNYVDVYARAAAASLQPTITVAYDDAEIIPSQISVTNAPTSGYINPRAPLVISWGYTITEPEACAADGVTQTSATLYWREGSSGNYNAIPIGGSGQSITIPANTFPTGSSIQYYIEGTDTVGSTSQTPVYTLSTAAGLVTATPVSPIGTVEDGSAAITLRWSAASNDGFPQDGADLQTSRDGSTWTDLANLTGAAVFYAVPADTFTAGNVFWRVRSYNIDGVAGPWSAAAQFVVVAAPPQPSVTVEAVPFATVNWQAEGQQAYRITVDGVTYGPYFGSEKTWTVPDYLPDGEHTITVEVQGVYGLWSQPGSASFTVQNQPGDAVTLSGEFERDGVLSWVTASQTADFLIYRDGVQIGHASAPAFTDRFALGEHSYQVINRLPGGYYTPSNVVTGTMISCVAAIAPLAGGDWIELTLSENSNREEAFVWTQAVSMRHFAGAEYPVAEQSPFADLSGSYDVSFADLPSAKAFEALRGQAVILKSRGGNVMIGILSTLSKRMTEFYIAFTFSLQRMHWRDFIDADDQL